MDHVAGGFDGEVTRASLDRTAADTAGIALMYRTGGRPATPVYVRCRRSPANYSCAVCTLAGYIKGDNCASFSPRNVRREAAGVPPQPSVSELRENV
ncbi:hypothetical protein J6590_050679 [Homalodisca vitripennis]|nr:hypothetical protein J6590_050679 [Homalodisca vitripennis]